MEATFAKSDIRDQPAYPLAEAARNLRVAPATLRSWVVGRPYPTSGGTGRFHPLVHPPSRRPPILSFHNLIEAHVLRSLRTEHGVPLKAVRQALQYAQKQLKIDRLLLREDLRTDAGHLFLERYGELINLSVSGQLAMRLLFDEHLKRVEWDARKFPIRLFPFVVTYIPSTDRPIAIDPKVAFGRPVVVAAGVSTRAIAERIDASETIAELAIDYGLSETDVEQAVLYERAA
ncbi:MAG: DUF433 domain-containing protein [Acidobacteria bacterium]|nr:DUF433 domain-containing protein [Acidobacteriota bacterium]